MKHNVQISGFELKIIAMMTMLTDHTAAIILERLLQSQEALYPWYQVMRCIGRMAFPIYIFLLVEGFHYTKNRKKYALRLFAFALISEVPFDIAFQHTYVDSSYNNVFFTLLIGLGAMCLSEKIRTLYFNYRIKHMLLQIALVFAAEMLAELLHTDYGAGGVLAIFVMYFLYHRKGNPTVFAAAVIVLSICCDISELFALLMLLPIAWYNGSRGKQVKALFYIFYPAHLILLELICVAAGIPLL